MSRGGKNRPRGLKKPCVGFGGRRLVNTFWKLYDLANYQGKCFIFYKYLELSDIFIAIGMIFNGNSATAWTNVIEKLVDVI